MKGKWRTNPSRKRKPINVDISDPVICRVVPPRLARMNNIADWLFIRGRVPKKAKDKDFALLREYKVLRELGYSENL